MRPIEVFADVRCPFTHVGLRRLVEERSRLGRHDVVIRARAWPLELVNGNPLDAGDVAEEVNALRGTVAPDLFTAFDATRFSPTSLPALSLAASAYAQGDDLGERVSLILRAALFEEGRDIADPGELATIAHSAAMASPSRYDEQAPFDDWREGQHRGVVGSPHFFVDDHGFFCPALAIQRVDDHLQIDPNPDAFAAFVRAVFDPASPA